MNRVKIFLAALAPAVMLVSCSNWEDAMTATIESYTVQLKTVPSPPLVGGNAELAVRILDDQDRSIRACHVSFRQHMPGMQMHTDDIVVRMEEQRSGVYTGTSPEYSMGGDWSVEVNFDCGKGVRHVNLGFHLEWPE